MAGGGGMATAAGGAAAATGVGRHAIACEFEVGQGCHLVELARRTGWTKVDKDAKVGWPVLPLHQVGDGERHFVAGAAQAGADKGAALRGLARCGDVDGDGQRGGGGYAADSTLLTQAHFDLRMTDMLQRIEELKTLIQRHLCSKPADLATLVRGADIPADVIHLTSTRATTPSNQLNTNEPASVEAGETRARTGQVSEASERGTAAGSDQAVARQPPTLSDQRDVTAMHALHTPTLTPVATATTNTAPGPAATQADHELDADMLRAVEVSISSFEAEEAARKLAIATTVTPTAPATLLDSDSELQQAFDASVLSFEVEDNMRKTLLQRVQQQAANLGFTILPTRYSSSDGNCLFTAIAACELLESCRHRHRRSIDGDCNCLEQSLEKLRERAVELRTLACDWLLCHRSLEQLTQECADRRVTVEAHLQQMRKPCTHATIAELIALVNVLKHRITVVATNPSIHPTEPIAPLSVRAKKMAPYVLGYYPDHGGHFVPCGKPADVECRPSTPASRSLSTSAARDTVLSCNHHWRQQSSSPFFFSSRSSGRLLPALGELLVTAANRAKAAPTPASASAISPPESPSRSGGVTTADVDHGSVCAGCADHSPTGHTRGVPAAATPRTGRSSSSCLSPWCWSRADTVLN